MKKRKAPLNMYGTLVMFALIPLIISCIVSITVLTSISNNKMKRTVNESMLTLIEGVGAGVNEQVAVGEQTLKSFATAPIVKEAILHPDDADIQAAAEKYTVDFFGQLDGWEGIYIADWNSKVLTHPAPPVIGRVMREGDSLKALQNGMIEAESGILNFGIITSPASGELVISMYVPVYDGKTPIGYVGGGTFVANICKKFSDVSSLNLSTAYMYVVDKDGIMAFHPTPDKIGKPVENAVVKSLVADIQAGKHPEAKCVEYDYKGTTKYASYFVGTNDYYIAVLTADEVEALSFTKTMKLQGFAIGASMALIFAVLALLICRLIASPIKSIAGKISNMSEGDFNNTIDEKSHVKEIVSLIDSAETLQVNMQNIVSEVSGGVTVLNEAVDTVATAVDTCNRAKDGINEAVEEMAKGATEMAESVQNNAESMSNMGSSIDNITDIVEETNKNAAEAEKIAVDAKKNLADLMTANNDTISTTDEVVKGILESSEAVKSIEGAANVITDIASQTNLLSLNASIEAARAGEAGRGFAVVAAEISKLAQQSDDSAREIRNIIDNVISKTEINTKLANMIKNSVENEGSVLTGVSESFENVSRSLDVMVSGINEIATMTNSLNADKNQVIDEISTLSSISEENAASTEETSASTEELGANIENINAQTEEIVEVVNRIAESMKFFK